MNKSKLFGICIVVLLAATLVNAINETMLNELLNSYDNQYSDGSFNVNIYNYSTVDWIARKEAGSVSFGFNITGSGSYTLVTVLNTATNATSYNNGVNLGGNVIVENSYASPGIKTLTYDGNLFSCTEDGLPEYRYATFRIDVRIIKDNIIRYENTFYKTTLCYVTPVQLDFMSSIAPTVKNTEGDARYDLVNVTLNFDLRENRTYVLGAYIWDNKTGIAYAERSVRPTKVVDFNNGMNVSFIFNASSLKNFNLNNEKILLKSLTIDGNAADWTRGAATWYNKMKPSASYSSSNFDFKDISISNYKFDMPKSNGKITQLGINLTALNAKGLTYDVAVSLENIYGEAIMTKKTTINNWLDSSIKTIYFNGTEIYESKINGLYRIGFIKITQGTNELLYKTEVAVSPDVSYINFTAPATAELSINDSDILEDGNNINVTLHNNGKGDATGITISAYDDNSNKKGEIIVDYLEANTDKTYVLKDANMDSGTVFIDFANEIEEDDETNNVAQLIPPIPPNIPPTLNPIGSRSMNENNLLQFTVTATDPDNATLIYSASGLPSGSAFNTVSHTFAWTPDFAQSGNYSITFSVTDKVNPSVSETINIEVKDVNRIPVITSNPSTTATKGIQYEYIMTATDADGDTLTYNVNDTIFTKIGLSTFRWTPNATGSWNFIFDVSDGKATVNQTVAITVADNITIIPPTPSPANTGGIINPSNPNTNDDLVCSPGRSGAFIYRWYMNDALQSSQKSNTISNALTEPSQRWRCEIFIPPTRYTGILKIAEGEVTIN